MDLVEQFEKILGIKVNTNEKYSDECFRLNVFREYNAMQDKLYNDYQKGRFLVLRATIKIAKFDPVNGEKKKNMTNEDVQYWTDIDKDIIDAGKILYKFDGINGLDDGLVWSFVPKRTYKYIHRLWNVIDEWKYYSRNLSH